MEQRRVGFTLVELLIAVTIFSVIAVALHSSFNAGIRVWRRAEENMELNQSIRLALEGMARELRNAINITEEGESAEGAETSEEEELVERPDLAFSGGASEISFVTLSTRLMEESDSPKAEKSITRFRKELAKVSYSLSEEGEFSRSIAYQSQAFTPGDSGGEILATDVLELKFEYSYEAEEEDSPPAWKDYWENQEGIPLGVKISLKAARKEKRPGDFLKTVFVPTGILGKEEEEEEQVSE